MEEQLRHTTNISERVSSACLAVQTYVDEKDIMMQKRRNQRVEEIQRLCHELQAILSHVLATLGDCLKDADQICEIREAQHVAAHILQKFRDVDEMQKMHRLRLELCLQLETNRGLGPQHV